MHASCLAGGNRTPVARSLFPNGLQCRLRPLLPIGRQLTRGRQFRQLRQLHQLQVCQAAPNQIPQIVPDPQAQLQKDSGTQSSILAHYKKLQNGSDIRGVASEGIADRPITLPASVAYFVGRGFAHWLSKRLETAPTSLTVSVGRDPRISGPIICAALAAGLASKGVNVTEFALSTTPAMFISCILPGHEYSGAIMVTASHLPFNRNGMKFCTAAGGLEKGDITDILALAADEADHEGAVPWAEKGQDIGYVMEKCMQVQPSLVHQVDFLPVYAAYMRDIIKKGVQHPHHYDTPLKGFHIVVNAGNGGGGFFATQVLSPLGARIEGSLNLEPDGMFPNHIPNPEDKKAMALTVEAVMRTGADLGIVFDTDVDRSGVVDSSGQVVNKNRYIALMAAITLRDYPNTTIVTCSTTSNGLTKFIEGLGGKHFRYRKGYRNVIGKGIQLNKEGVDCELMMETSGHGAMRENYFLDDGAYAAVKILIEVVRQRLAGGGGLEQMLADLHEPVEAGEYRLPIQSSEGSAVGEQVLRKFHDWVVAGAGGSTWKLEEENFEGWRVAVDEGEGRSGWLLMRNSLHDPQTVVNVESEVPGGLRKILACLEKFFETIPEAGVDTSPVFRRLAEQ